MNQTQAFKEVMGFFEATDDQQLTVRFLVNMMIDFPSNSDEAIYSQFYM